MGSDSDLSWLDDVRLPYPLNVADDAERQRATDALPDAERWELFWQINRDFHSRRMARWRSLHADATPDEFRQIVIDRVLNGDPDKARKAWIYTCARHGRPP
jgi:hypothetical protein